MDLPKLDFSHTTNLASGLQASIEKSNRRTMEIAESVAENRRKMQDAIEQTAVNTSETNNQLQKVIGNQGVKLSDVLNFNKARSDGYDKLSLFTVLLLSLAIHGKFVSLHKLEKECRYDLRF